MTENGDISAVGDEVVACMSELQVTVDECACVFGEKECRALGRDVAAVRSQEEWRAAMSFLVHTQAFEELYPRFDSLFAVSLPRADGHSGRCGVSDP